MPFLFTKALYMPAVLKSIEIFEYLSIPIIPPSPPIPPIFSWITFDIAVVKSYLWFSNKEETWYAATVLIKYSPDPVDEIPQVLLLA